MLSISQRPTSLLCVLKSSAEKPQHHDDDVKVGNGSGRVQLQRAGTIIEKHHHIVYGSVQLTRERSRK